MPTALWVGPVAVAALAAGWLAVMSAWRTTFADTATDADPLAGRPGCRGCGECERECERRPSGRADSEQEGQR